MDKGDNMGSIKAWFDGKKTYITGIGMILSSLGAGLKGVVTPYEAALGVWNGFAFIFLRQAVNTAISPK